MNYDITYNLENVQTWNIVVYRVLLGKFFNKENTKESEVKRIANNA